jgi:hypothetical protein
MLPHTLIHIKCAQGEYSVNNERIGQINMVPSENTACFMGDFTHMLKF